MFNIRRSLPPHFDPPRLVASEQPRRDRTHGLESATNADFLDTHNLPPSRVLVNGVMSLACGACVAGTGSSKSDAHCSNLGQFMPLLRAPITAP
jgi:hypothetical protein